MIMIKCPITCVKEFNGAPTMFVNGKPFPGTNYRSLSTNTFQGNLNLQICTIFGKLGIHSYTMGTTPTLKTWSSDGWLAPDRYRYDEMDSDLASILEVDPDAYLIPFVNIGTPQWWADEHPEEIFYVMNEDGDRVPYKLYGAKVGDYASKRWRQDMGEALRHYLQHIQKMDYGERVIGYQLGSYQNEGHYGAHNVPNLVLSFSEASIKGFREWLMRKYGKLERLNDAWASSHRSFDDIQPPTLLERNRVSFGQLRDPKRDRSSIDYNEFYAECFADSLSYFAEIVKEETKGRALVTVFYGYIIELVGLHLHDCGMMALDRIWNCPHIDIVTAPASYRFRSPGSGYPCYMSTTESVRLHGKVWLAQNDYRTYLAAARMGEFGRTATAKETLQQYRAVCLSDVAHGFPTQFHDLDPSSWFSSKEMQEMICEYTKVQERALYSDRQQVNEIALILDPRSTFFVGRQAERLSMDLIPNLIRHLGHTGAPFGIYTLNDMDCIPPHKLWIFPNCISLSKSQVKKLVNRMAREGAHALWFYAAGASDEEIISAENISRLVGFAVAADSEKEARLIRFDDGTKISYDKRQCKPLFYLPQEEGLQVLARHEDGRAAVAFKSIDGWTSIYSSVPALTPGVLRKLARDAGVHIYCDGDEIVYANRSFVGVVVQEPGLRRIRLPEPSSVVDVFAGRLVNERCREFEAEFNRNEAKLFFLGTLKEWKGKNRNKLLTV